MATSAPTQAKPELEQMELDRLGEDFFHLAESQLAHVRRAPQRLTWG